MIRQKRPAPPQRTPLSAYGQSRSYLALLRRVATATHTALGYALPVPRHPVAEREHRAVVAEYGHKKRALRLDPQGPVGVMPERPRLVVGERRGARSAPSGPYVRSGHRFPLR